MCYVIYRYFIHTLQQQNICETQINRWCSRSEFPKLKAVFKNHSSTPVLQLVGLSNHGWLKEQMYHVQYVSLNCETDQSWKEKMKILIITIDPPHTNDEHTWKYNNYTQHKVLLLMCNRRFLAIFNKSENANFFRTIRDVTVVLLFGL